MLAFPTDTIPRKSIVHTVNVNFGNHKIGIPSGNTEIIRLTIPLIYKFTHSCDAPTIVFYCIQLFVLKRPLLLAEYIKLQHIFALRV